MIVLQHLMVNDHHKRRMEEMAGGRHKIVVTKDFLDVPDLAETEILFTFGKGILDETIKKMPNLKWIQLCSTGFDHLPIDYIIEHGIQVTTSKGTHAEPIAEYAFSCMFYFARKMDVFLKLQKEKKWYRLNHPTEITGKTVLILGTGYIGKEIAKKAKAFNMISIGINRTGTISDPFNQVYTFDDLSNVLPNADYLILSLPLTELTNQVIGMRQLELLRPTSVVINLGRGELIDETAALEALRASKIRGMAMDVFSKEPLPKDSPLWEMDNLLITPHMAALTDRFLDRSMERFVENYRHYLKGEQLVDFADFSKGY